MASPITLTLKQGRVVEEYLATGNAADATRKAYNAPTPRIYEQIAYDNLCGGGRVLASDNSCRDGRDQHG